MTKSEYVDQIMGMEWEMFRSVNGDTRADCQENRDTFEVMRRAQYDAWSEEAVRCYAADVRAAAEAGRNLPREKYIRMMESTDPMGYAALSLELPPVTETQRTLAAALWQRYLRQTLRLRERYPVLALGGRPTYAAEEQGWASVETYQTCESLTYSEATLRALIAHFDALEAQGIDLVTEIMKNTVHRLGYADLDAAEAAMSAQLRGQTGAAQQ